MTDSRKNYYERKNRKRRRRIQRIKMCMVGISAAILVLFIYIVTTLCSLIFRSIEYSKADSGTVVEGDPESSREEESETDALAENSRGRIMEKLSAFAGTHNFSVEEYPEEMIGLLEKYPEIEEYVLNYPLEKGNYSNEDLNQYLNMAQVPLFLQWDSRWGYYEYGSGPMGLTGCGPTCLSMVALHLLQNPKMTPVYIADYAQQNGFYVQGIGTAWDLMSSGAEELGLESQEVPLSENMVLRYLEQGKPIICAMGPGAFTETGHFIVFVGTEQGKILVNDPNSKENSAKLWDFEEIQNQIKNMWVYSVR